MARTPSRFVAPLTAEEEEMLRCLRDQGETARIRKRAHAILLSAAGQSINELAKTFEVTRDTVRNWLARFEREACVDCQTKNVAVGRRSSRKRSRRWPWIC